MDRMIFSCCSGMKFLMKDFAMAPPPVSVMHKGDMPVKSYPVEFKNNERRYQKQNLNGFLQIDKHGEFTSVRIY